MQNLNFKFDGIPYEVRGSDVFRLSYEKDGREYEERKLSPVHSQKKLKYTLSGAVFSLEEIINLANKNNGATQKPLHQHR
jgi:hypothetical protein